MDTNAPHALQRQVEAVLNTVVAYMRPINGGDTAEAFETTLRGGERLFIKRHARGRTMFEPEAEGLQWLAAAGALPVPAVVAVGETFLALEWIETSVARHRDEEALGHGLAALHRSETPQFGWSRDNWIGTLSQTGSPRATWSEFYRECRLEPLLTRAQKRGLISPAVRSEFDRLFLHFEDRCGPQAPPARLHGDLWVGNVLFDVSGAPWLIDPAVYGGHREIDLAMMHLFGGFSDRCFAAYHESFPLDPGFDERLPLYQLYPLLVHVNMFGRTYVGQTLSALRALL